MTGVLRPGLFPIGDEVEPLRFNLFQIDTIEALILRCAEAGEESEDRDDYADARMVQETFPPMAIGHRVLLVHPDDDRVVEEEVELAHVPGAAAAAMARLIDRFADRVRFDDEAHAATKRAPEDAGANRADFLALDPAPGVPVLEHPRLAEVLAELRAFLEGVRFGGFTLEL